MKQPPPVTKHSLREQRRLKVLLAEDNIINQKVAVNLVERGGHDVSVACNGQEAVVAWRKGKFDLILMDVQMPVLDGLAATAAIRQAEAVTGAHVPIIGVTAHALQGDREPLSCRRRAWTAMSPNRSGRSCSGKRLPG